jgi:hypothetical protein
MTAKQIAWAIAAVASLGSLAYGVSCVDNNADPCPSYCLDIAATCTGDNAQYPTDNNNKTCLQICHEINALDSGTNTVACRALNVSSAKDETDPKAKHDDCVGAGVSAINCGASQCAAYCEVLMAGCGSQSPPPYTSLQACEDTCKTWDPTFVGQLIGSTGDNLECRTYHFELSQTGNPADLVTHCAHTAALSARCNDGGAPPADSGTDSSSDAATDASSDAASDAAGD